MRVVSCLVGVILASGLAVAAPEEGEVVATAPVVVDGVALFPVRGTSAMPAAVRADAIADRIRAVARDRTIEATALTETQVEGGVEIAAGKRLVMLVTDADAQLEGVDRTVVARMVTARIRTAIEDYRHDRGGRALLRATGIALLTAAALVVALFVLWRAFARLDASLERRFGERVRHLRVKAFPVMDATKAWESLRAALRATRFVLVAAAVVVALEVGLEVFPWTRAVSRGLLSYILDPVRSIASAIIGYVPNAVFLVILVLITRWAIKLLGVFFRGVDRGAIQLESFDAEWALPTFRLVRIAVLAFALVVAYPYLPGSSSGAFKGVSLFLGVMLSIGSSAAISNIIAGYSLTYRRAFKVGDLIRVGEHTGFVSAVRLLVTHLRTIKNEEIVVPNSIVLNSEIVNYSTISRKEGLILHTTVGIGYEVPWRQVEAMLLRAAERTPGLRAEPPPFVLQTALGDFAVTYQLNAYADGPTALAKTYSELHKNIQDVFNEFGVQIMTPAYEGDPAEPKVVPKERWFESPARSPEGGSRA